MSNGRIIGISSQLSLCGFSINIKQAIIQLKVLGYGDRNSICTWTSCLYVDRRRTDSSRFLFPKRSIEMSRFISTRSRAFEILSQGNTNEILIEGSCLQVSTDCWQSWVIEIALLLRTTLILPADSLPPGVATLMAVNVRSRTASEKIFASLDARPRNELFANSKGG